MLISENPPPDFSQPPRIEANMILRLRRKHAPHIGPNKVNHGHGLVNIDGHFYLRSIFESRAIAIAPIRSETSESFEGTQNPRAIRVALISWARDFLPSLPHLEHGEISFTSTLSFLDSPRFAWCPCTSRAS